MPRSITSGKNSCTNVRARWYSPTSLQRLASHRTVPRTPSLPIERRQADRAVRLEPHGLIKRAHRFFIAPALVEQPPGAPIAFSSQALRLLLSPDLLIGLDRLIRTTTIRMLGGQHHQELRFRLA